MKDLSRDTWKDRTSWCPVRFVRLGSLGSSSPRYQEPATIDILATDVGSAQDTTFCRHLTCCNSKIIFHVRSVACLIAFPDASFTHRSG